MYDGIMYVVFCVDLFDGNGQILIGMDVSQYYVFVVCCEGLVVQLGRVEQGEIGFGIVVSCYGGVVQVLGLCGCIGIDYGFFYYQVIVLVLVVVVVLDGVIMYERFVVFVFGGGVGVFDYCVFFYCLWCVVEGGVLVIYCQCWYEEVKG